MEYDISSTRGFMSFLHEASEEKKKHYSESVEVPAFYEYRKRINKNFIDGWWQREIAKELESFINDLNEGKRPKLVIQSPPQHGKSVQIIDLISYLLGIKPETRMIYASFSERLGVRANLATQRTMTSDEYKSIFPTAKIPERNAVTVSGQKLRNREIIELTNSDGFFRNTTVKGSVTGESCDLGIIDDPLKGRAEANSMTTRNAVWDWMTNDFFTRFSKDAGLIIILTRWHIDDPVGRLIEADNNVKVISYPAIATHDEKYRKEGEALFPELKPIDFLLERKKLLGSSHFEALYQQNPTVDGGGLFKTHYWQFYESLPKLRNKIIYADTAIKTKESNDFSVFQLWATDEDNRLYLVDQVRGKWEAPELLDTARSFYRKHQEGYPSLSAFKVEDKASGTQLIQTLRREGIPIVGIPRSIDKLTRAMGAVPLIESGNVFLPRNVHWLPDYLIEFTQFPYSKHDDQVDPTIDAIEDILTQPTWNYEDL